MTRSVFGVSCVNHLGDQGKAEDDKQSSCDCIHGGGPFAAAVVPGYWPKRAKI